MLYLCYSKIIYYSRVALKDLAADAFIGHKSSEKISKNCNPCYSNLECDHTRRAAEFASSVYLLGQSIAARS